MIETTIYWLGVVAAIGLLLATIVGVWYVAIVYLVRNTRETYWTMAYKLYTLGYPRRAKSWLCEAIEEDVGCGPHSMARFLDAISYLRMEEGDHFEILCQNPNGVGPDNEAIICYGAWTGWRQEGLRFEGSTLFEAIWKARNARERIFEGDDSSGQSAV